MYIRKLRQSKKKNAKNFIINNIIDEKKIY